jgi:radical SAM-linked protein
MADPGFRLRIRFAKTGRLRFLSHLEVMRASERSVRRAGLPYSITQGFSPKMRVAFGPALPVGTAGLREYFDVWLSAYVPAGEAQGRLAALSPEALVPVFAGYVAEKGPSLSAALTIARYEVTVAAPAMGPERLDEALRDVVGAGELAVEHRGKLKVFDLTRALPKEPGVRSAEDGLVVDITTRMGPEGSLRPESLVDIALVRSGLLGRISSVTRTALFVETKDGWSEALE